VENNAITKKELAQILGEIMAYHAKTACETHEHEYEAFRHSFAGMQLMAYQLAKKAGISFDYIKACYYAAR
jgi:hypothetical protein